MARRCAVELAGTKAHISIVNRALSLQSLLRSSAVYTRWIPAYGPAMATPRISAPWWCVVNWFRDRFCRLYHYAHFLLGRIPVLGRSHIFECVFGQCCHCNRLGTTKGSTDRVGR